MSSVSRSSVLCGLDNLSVHVRTSSKGQDSSGVLVVGGLVIVVVVGAGVVAAVCTTLLPFVVALRLALRLAFVVLRSLALVPLLPLLRLTATTLQGANKHRAKTKARPPVWCGSELAAAGAIVTTRCLF